MIRRTRVRVPCCLIDDPRPIVSFSSAAATKKAVAAARRATSASASPKSLVGGSTVSSPPLPPVDGFFCEKEDCAVYVLAEPVIAADGLDAAISSRLEVFFNISSICQLLKVFSARRCKFLAKDFLKFVEQHRYDAPQAVQSVAQSVADVQARRSCYADTGVPLVRTCEPREHTVNSALLEKVAGNWQPFSDVRKPTCTDCKLDLFRLTNTLHFEEENHQDSINDRLLALYVARISQNKRFSRVPGFLYWLVDVAAPLLKAVVQRELHLALLLHSVRTSTTDASADVGIVHGAPSGTSGGEHRPRVVGAGIARKKISMNLCDYSLPSQTTATTTTVGANGDTSDSEGASTADTTAVQPPPPSSPPPTRVVSAEEDFLLEQTDNANDQDIFSSISFRSLFDATPGKDAASSVGAATASSFFAYGNDTQDEWLRFLTHGAAPTYDTQSSVDPLNTTTNTTRTTAGSGSCFRAGVGPCSSPFATAANQPLDLSVK